MRAITTSAITAALAGGAVMSTSRSTAAAPNAGAAKLGWGKSDEAVQHRASHKEIDMKRTLLIKRAIAIGIVGAIAFGETVPSFAAPVLSSTAVVKMTAPNTPDQVRARRSRGRAIGAGVALGVLGAVVGAAAAQNRYYYGPGYYGPGYYGGPVYYGPYYYRPYRYYAPPPLFPFFW